MKVFIAKAYGGEDSWFWIGRKVIFANSKKEARRILEDFTEKIREREECNEDKLEELKWSLTEKEIEEGVAWGSDVRIAAKLPYSR